MTELQTLLDAVKSRRRELVRLQSPQYSAIRLQEAATRVRTLREQLKKAEQNLDTTMDEVQNVNDNIDKADARIKALDIQVYAKKHEKTILAILKLQEAVK